MPLDGSVQLPSGEWRSGHWVYPVAWDGQSGLTIRYAEDLLRPAESFAGRLMV